MRRGSSGVIVAVGLFAGGEAQADPRPIRLDYQAHAGCPAAAVLVEEITWRTPLAKFAAPGEDATLVRARITRRGATSRGTIVIARGKEKISREITGPSCDEIVSALGLVTALAIDPRASTGRKPPPPPPPPPAPQVPRPLPTEPPPPALPPPIEPDLVASPLPAFPVAHRSSARWIVGARASIAVAPAPRPLFGGGVFVARLLDARAGAWLRLAAEAATTGSFDAGPGGASFVRLSGRIDGCAFAIRPAAWLTIVPCLGAEGGALRGEGVLRGSLTTVGVATVPWVGLGLLPAAAIDLGGFVIEAQAGPVFPLVRRQFVFERPDYLVHDVPPVTFAASFGAGLTFP